MNLNIQPINFNIQNVRFKSNPISNPYNNQNLERSPEKDSFEMSVGYVNDTHGQVNNMMRILSGIKGDLKLAGGDIDIGDEKNEAIHYATTKFLNIADIKATVLGNHEIDMNQKSCIDAINRFNGDLLAINFDQKPLSEQSEEEIKKFGRADLKSYLKKSTVVEVKGEKIGLIGACPMDMLERLTHPNYYTDCSIEDLDDTIEDIQEEVDRMKTEGINKIILLSHMGHKRDKIAAKKLDGIDVIIGGHTHELIKDIKEGENLLYSKSGEPVIITEAGREGNYFGKLNLTFDKDGVITKAQNNIGETRLFHKNMINQYVFDDILGEPEKVGYVKQAPPPPSNLAEENPHANFVCDIMREKTNSDIALWHHSGVRSFFHEGEIDSRDVKDMAPFLDYVVVAEVPEDIIVDAFKKAIKATYDSPVLKPGLLAVSGLNYTVNPDEGTLTDMNFIDKNGVEHKIDINNPRKDKTYRVVTDEFLMSAGADYNVLAPEELYVEKYPYDKDVLASAYIKEMNEPIVINQYGRIRYENHDDDDD